MAMATQGSGQIQRYGCSRLILPCQNLLPMERMLFLFIGSLWLQQKLPLAAFVCPGAGGIACTPSTRMGINRPYPAEPLNPAAMF
jgi:hypothetical protein